MSGCGLEVLTIKDQSQLTKDLLQRCICTDTLTLSDKSEYIGRARPCKIDGGG